MCRRSLLPVSLLAAILSSTPLSAAVTFKKVVTLDSRLPGITHPLMAFGQPAIKGKTLAFMVYEESPPGVAGPLSIIQQKNGVLRKVATSGTSTLNGQIIDLSGGMPYSAPMIRPDGAIAFEGSLRGLDFTPVLVEWNNGKFRRLFGTDEAATALGGEVTWNADLSYITEDGRVVREVRVTDATRRSQQAIIQEQNGKVSVLQRPDILLPPDEITGSGFLDWSAFQDGLLFYAWPAANRIYRREGETVSLIGTPYVDGGFPGLDGSMSPPFHSVATQKLSLMYGNRRPSDGSPERPGLYGWTGGSWFTVLEGGMPTPAGGIFAQSVETINDLSLDGDSLAFHCHQQEGDQILLYHQGVIYPVLLPGEKLFGRAPTSISMSTQSLSGKTLTFCAFFDSDPKEGVYTADLSSLMPDKITLAPMSVDFTGGRSMKLTAPSPHLKNNYYLQRSSDLMHWTTVDRKSGSTLPIVFERNDEAIGSSQAFFRIEEGTP